MIRIDPRMDIHGILVVFYFLVSNIQIVELAIRPCPLSQYEHLGTCCKKCRPGTFVRMHCNKTSQTVCEPCKDGTFSKDWTSREQCTPCGNRHCQPTMDHVQICNSTIDNQCGCKRLDQFHDAPTDSCMDCRSCPPGQYPVNPCTRGTICQDCPKDHYSNKTTMDKRCLECTKCTKYISKCSPTQDSICVKIPPRPQESFTTAKVQAFAENTPTLMTEKLNSTDLPSKTSKMGPIIITVIVVVCVTTVMIFIAIVIYLRKSIETYNGFNNIVQESRRNFSFGGLLLRKQPGEIILGLHALLNPESQHNWRAVAADIGVPYLQICNFESDDINTATKEMLYYWGTSNDATVDRLYQALRKLGRDDACTFLEENVDFESVETIV